MRPDPCSPYARVLARVGARRATHKPLSVTPLPCQSPGVDPAPREAASELRAIAPLIVTGPQRVLVGPCTLVTNGTQTIAFSSAELLRQAGEPLAIALTFDCVHTIPVTAWTMSRTHAMGIIELGAAFPLGNKALDVEPISIASIYASADTRGAPAALVGVHADDNGRLSRRIVPVHVDAIDGGGMSDDIITRLASPDSALDLDAEIDGAALVAWMPADPVLGRKAEVVIAALACTYRQGAFKPRDLPALAELYGLHDLGRALPWQASAPAAAGSELGLVAGEIKDDESGQLAGIDQEGD
jgi:hypothetical protein